MVFIEHVSGSPPSSHGSAKCRRNMKHGSLMMCSRTDRRVKRVWFRRKACQHAERRYGRSEHHKHEDFELTMYACVLDCLVTAAKMKPADCCLLDEPVGKFC